MTDAELEQLADLFDQAMTSDNPTVRRAFRNLLMVAAIDQAENAQAGPIRELLNRIKRLETRLNSVEGQWVRPQAPTPFNPGAPYQPTPMPTTWPNTTYPIPNTIYSTGTGNVPITAVGASSTAYDDQYSREEYAPLPPSKYQDFMERFK